MVKKALSKITNGVFSTQKTVLSAAAILAAVSGINALLGFVKSRSLASFFGVSNDLAVFYTADKLPSLVYSVLVVGALSTVFIPVFTEALAKDKEHAWQVSSTLLVAGLLLFSFFGVLILVFAPFVIRVLSVYQFTEAEVMLGASLMRIMIGAQLVLVISSFISSILNSFKYFLIPALSTVVYNLGFIAGIVFLAPVFGIYGPAFGVLLGSVLHFVLQLPCLLKVKFRFAPTFNLKDRDVVQLFSLMPPRILSVLLAHGISTINNSLAILVSTSSVIYLKFATQLEYFPVSLFGVSLAAALLPTLSQEVASKNTQKFKKIFLTSLHQMLFLVIPVSVILFVLRVPVVRLVYGVSNFPWEATVKTSYALAFFSISVFAQGAVYLITRAFYALKDTATPVKVSIITAVINIALSLFFIRVLGFGVWSIAFSFSVTSFLDMLIMLWILSQRLGRFDLRSVFVPFVKISYAAVFMGIALYLPLKLLDDFVFDTSKTIWLAVLTLIASVFGMGTYLVLTKWFKVEEIEIFYKLLRKLSLLKPKQPLESPSPEVV